MTNWNLSIQLGNSSKHHIWDFYRRFMLCLVLVACLVFCESIWKARPAFLMRLCSAGGGTNLAITDTLPVRGEVHQKTGSLNCVIQKSFNWVYWIQLLCFPQLARDEKHSFGGLEGILAFVEYESSIPWKKGNRWAASTYSAVYKIAEQPFAKLSRV